ncbi:MAG: hypothetical protein LAT66_01535 [Alkalimonas sp.]|nr:hypothetical protein [Alkalimonas sp.]
MQFKLSLCAAVFVTATSVVAESKPDISWNYLSVGYAKASIKWHQDELGETQRLKPDGWQLHGSFLLSEQLYVRGRYDRVTDTWFGVNLKAEQSWLSLGLRQQVMPGMDTFFEAGYAKHTTTSELAFRDRNSGNGYQLGAGVRYLAAPALELGAAIRHVNVSGVDNTTLGELSARYRLSQQFDLYSNYLFESDGSILGVGVSFHF